MIILCFLFLFTIVNSAEDNRVTIHFVPHSHCDVGWQNTIDGYFYREASAGTSFTATMGSVNSMITNVVNSLLDNPERRFAWAEMKFFTMWWDLQGTNKRN